MARVLVAPDDTQDSQWLKIDSSQRYIENHSAEWQFLFGPNSEPTNSSQIIKIAGQFNTNTLDAIRLTGYLYNTKNGTIDTSSGISFKIYRVDDDLSPRWNDVEIYTVAGVLQSNGYYFAEVNVNLLPGTTLDGDTTLMIEATATRLGINYRDRIYLNHLGVYDSIIRLRQDVEYLDITKLDE